MIHVGSGFGASLSPQRIEAVSGRFMNALGEHLLAGYDKKMREVAARKPAAKAKPAPKPAAARKPVRPVTRADRAARLRAAEASVRASQPKEARCVWLDMVAG